MHQLPWIEKHRPKLLEDVVGNQSIVEVLKVFAVEKSLPNLILTGPPGTGKTTVVQCMINGMYSAAGSCPRDSVIELNASDERGVDVVRTKIKGFLQKKLASGDCPLRFVVLDEADSMTASAQQSMRRLLEKYADARFVFICNDATKISDGIQSRCAMLRFIPLEESDLKLMVRRVAEKESLELTEDALSLVSESSEGDARQAINLVQTLSNITTRITEEDVSALVSTPPIQRVRAILEALPANPAQAVLLLDALFSDGYAPEDIAKIFFRCGRDQNSLPLMGATAALLLRIADGCKSRLQFYAAIHALR